MMAYSSGRAVLRQAFSAPGMPCQRRERAASPSSAWRSPSTAVVWGPHLQNPAEVFKDPNSTVTPAELRVMHTASTQPAAAGVLKHTSCLPAALPRQGNKRQREGEGDDKTPVGLCAQACRSTTSPGEPLLRSSSSPSWSRPRLSGL